MLYTFLCLADLQTGLKDEYLNQLTGGSSTIIAQAETAAVTFMEGYLNERFDVAAIFHAVSTWSGQVPYTLGQPAYNNGFYVALADNLNIAPDLTTVDTWMAADPRNAKLVSDCVDITLFHLYRRINPMRIPQMRVDLYNEAKEWLKAVAGVGDGPKLSPLLPRKLDVTESVDNVLWGSNPARTHYF